MIREDLDKAKEKIRLSKGVLACLGRLPCEAFTGASILSTKAGTCWDTIEWGNVWVSYSPDAALYDPSLVVQISRIIKYAARDAGIQTESANIPMFRWEEYEFKHKF